MITEPNPNSAANQGWLVTGISSSGLNTPPPNANGEASTDQITMTTNVGYEVTYADGTRVYVPPTPDGELATFVIDTGNGEDLGEESDSNNDAKDTGMEGETNGDVKPDRTNAPSPAPEAGGCSTTPTPANGTWAFAAGLAALLRRKRN